MKKATYFIELLFVISNNVSKDTTNGIKIFIEKISDEILQNSEIFQSVIFLKLIKRNMLWINEFDEVNKKNYLLINSSSRTSSKRATPTSRSA